ncbi:hypothetical protein DVH05_011493 [Phytophthora capsici]|nr:hypothetical protein DVH05_011493 [Phytophthora capsici]
MSAAPSEPSPYLYPVSGPDSSVFTFKKVMAATVDEQSSVKFMMHHGLCRHCEDQVTLDALCRRWRCHRKGCHNYEVSVRAGTFFAKSKLPLSKCLRLLV